MSGFEKIAISLIHLGCPKNLVDTEKILGNLALQEDYIICQEPEDSDVVLINTCGFIEDARKEARKTIKATLKKKKHGPIQAVIAIGCMVELYKEKLLQEFPELDGIIGFSDYKEIGKYIHEILQEKQKVFLSEKNFIPSDDLRLRVTSRNYAYLRVTEGCSNHCTYCTIPSIRGEMRSKNPSQILQEAQTLVADEVKELIVIGQDTANYGKDLSPQSDLYSIVEELSKLDGLKWIRIMYMHPAHFSERFFQLFSLPKVIPYLEMPIQHINTRILRLMGRGNTSKEYLENLFAKLRSSIPGLVLRSTVMVGFPGETEQEFEELLAFLKQARIERLGAFCYSPEPGTKAYQNDDMPAKVKKERYEKVMQLQQEIAFAWSENMVGKELEVVVEDCVEDGLWQCRSYGEAPEIDPCVYLSGKKLKPGTFHRVRVIQSENYDLIAKKI
ncbi:MAG: 30S ribosomal protein S12 methylthiotransferase RimO [Candidatus Brocadiae bacterium]|nr:30S ribosomal protein S12 methylthiotransferase RimO [Candidatus Brocadiia bacterium]